jgi:hypothetical protein
MEPTRLWSLSVYAGDYGTYLMLVRRFVNASTIHRRLLRHWEITALEGPADRQHLPPDATHW